MTLGLLFDFKAQTLDTINFVDSNGKKQGQWIVTGKDKQGTCYKSDQKIETGKYKDDRKTGVWTEYFCNGNIKNILTFKNGRPEGPAKTYFESGNIKEEGTWQANRWVGKYKSYSDDGKVQELFFDEKGLREGTKTIYPYENNEPVKGNFKSKDTIRIYDYPDKKIIEKNSSDSLYRPK